MLLHDAIPASELNSRPDKPEGKSCAAAHGPLCSPVRATLWGGRRAQGQVTCRCQSSLCLLSRSRSGLSLQSRAVWIAACFTHRHVPCPLAELAELWWLLSSRNKGSPGVSENRQQRRMLVLELPFHDTRSKGILALSDVSPGAR